jgi:hypothetical protein
MGMGWAKRQSKKRGMREKEEGTGERGNKRHE